MALERKVVSVLVWESQETHRCVTDCHDMTLAVTVALKGSDEWSFAMQEIFNWNWRTVFCYAKNSKLDLKNHLLLCRKFKNSKKFQTRSACPDSTDTDEVKTFSKCIKEIHPSLKSFFISFRHSLKFHSGWKHSMIVMYTSGHQMFAFAMKFQWASKGLWPWFNDGTTALSLFFMRCGSNAFTLDWYKC